MVVVSGCHLFLAFPVVLTLHVSPYLLLRGFLCGGARMAASTCAINARSSSSETKRVAWPDTTCSTRPVQRPCAISVSARNCTTKARRGDRADGASAGGCTLLLSATTVTRLPCNCGDFMP